jgi:hypothetical protein
MIITTNVTTPAIIFNLLEDTPELGMLVYPPVLS